MKISKLHLSKSYKTICNNLNNDKRYINIIIKKMSSNWDNSSEYRIKNPTYFFVKDLTIWNEDRHIHSLLWQVWIRSSFFGICICHCIPSSNLLAPTTLPWSTLPFNKVRKGFGLMLFSKGPLLTGELKFFWIAKFTHVLKYMDANFLLSRLKLQKSIVYLV